MKNDPGRRSPSLVVWGTWGIMVVAVLAFVWKYGSNVPSWDGWDMVPTLTSAQPVTWSWLWSQHNEHRVPLPRLILLGLNKVTVLDFRGGMYLDVCIMAALAAAMIVIARRLRGTTSYTDLFFPLILLDWGQAQNLIWDWQIQFIASEALSSVVLLVIVQAGAQIKIAPAGIITGICLLLLPLTGGNGVALVPALAIWLAYLGIIVWRSAENRGKRNSLFIFSLCIGSLVLATLYFVGWENVPWHSRSLDWATRTKALFLFYMNGFGPANQSLPWLAGAMVLIFLVLSAVVLIHVMRTQPHERPRAFGLLLFLGAIASLGLGIAITRGVLEPRYGSLVIPAWCCIYYVVSLYTPPKINVSARAILLGVMVVSWWPNTQLGVVYAKDVREHLAAFESDMTAGVPMYKLIRHHQPYLHINQDLLHDYLPMLRDAGVGKFRWLRANPPFREVGVPLVPSDMKQIRWENDTIYSEDPVGQWPYILFPLSNARYVAGVRLKYAYWNNEGTAPCRYISWRRPGQKDFPKDQESKHCPTGDRANWFRGSWVKLADAEAISMAWTDDIVQEIKVIPDGKSGIMHLSELTLLVPVEN